MHFVPVEYFVKYIMLTYVLNHTGEDVLVVGFGVFGQSCGPSVTAGILSRVITCDSRPVMLQTTCAVHAGASGGAVLRAGTGELLGNALCQI